LAIATSALAQQARLKILTGGYYPLLEEAACARAAYLRA